MVQYDFFELDTATYRFIMDSKTPDSPSIEASPGTNHIFVTTHADHLHTPQTRKWDFTSTNNIDLGSFSLSLKYLTLRGDQVFNLRN